jgi:hypothetical protein
MQAGKSGLHNGLHAFTDRGLEYLLLGVLPNSTTKPERLAHHGCFAQSFILARPSKERNPYG